MSVTVPKKWEGTLSRSVAHKTNMKYVLLLENTANEPESVQVLYNRPYTEQMGPSLSEAVICWSSKTMGVKGER